MAHWNTKTDSGGYTMIRAVRNGDTLVMPGLFFVSGAAIGEANKRKMLRASKNRTRDAPFCEVVRIHWKSTPKLVVLFVVIVLCNVVMIAINRALSTEQFCEEYDSRECLLEWIPFYIIFHGWYCPALLLCQALFFFYSAARAYTPRSHKWYICYAVQAVVFSGALGYVVGTNFRGLYETDYTGTKIGYLLTHFGVLAMTMLPHGKRFAFPVYITLMWYVFSWNGVDDKESTLPVIYTWPCYFMGFLSREDAFLTGWLRKQMTTYLWLPIFSVFAVSMLSNDCIGSRDYRMKQLPHQWVASLYTSFVLYACGLEEMLRHLHITRAQNLSSIAFYAFHVLIIEIFFQMDPYYWKGDGYWFSLGMPYFFHGAMLLIMSCPSCKRCRRTKIQSQTTTAENAPTALKPPENAPAVKPSGTNRAINPPASASLPLLPGRVL